MKTCKDCIHYDVCQHEIVPTDIHPSYIDFSYRDDALLKKNGLMIA